MTKNGMMTMKERSSQKAKKRSQLYQEAIANFIPSGTTDPKSQAEERRILASLKARADQLQKVTG
jgi:hypothetical protein